MKKVGKKNSSKHLFLGGGNFSCTHPKLYKWLISNLKAFFIGGAISFVVTASATVILHSRQVRYKNDKSVEQDINELYEKADELFAYHIGDEIQVNGIDFYVIADSPATQDYVVAIKKDALTVVEVNTYGGVGTDNNHVNRYTYKSQGEAVNIQKNGYGGVAYYTSETCGYINDNFVTSGCINNYNESDIKYIVDNWALFIFNNNELKSINGYAARLIMKNELDNISNSYNWKYGPYDKYWYWTMTPANQNNSVWYAHWNKEVYKDVVYFGKGNSGLISSIRPVINVYKSAIKKTN